MLRGRNQVPYLVHRTSISHFPTLSVTQTNAPKRPTLSRWIIKLPRAGLPLTHLRCRARSPLFQRDVTLFDEAIDERGGTYRRPLAAATWTQTPDRKSPEFALSLSGRMQTDTLVLETENGDNAPIGLEKFTASYAATRVLFKARARNCFCITATRGRPRRAMT
jgi:hypothetical protein